MGHTMQDALFFFTISANIHVCGRHQKVRVPVSNE